MSQTNTQKDSSPSEVRILVEVDGNPVGFLNLDLSRLWPLLNHPKRDHLPGEWMDASKFDSIMRAAVVKRLMERPSFARAVQEAEPYRKLFPL